MAHITHGQRRNAHLDLFRFINSHLCLIPASSTIALLSKSRKIGDLIERSVFAVRIDDQDARLIVGLHQLFNQHAGKVALTRACAGDDSNVRTHNIFYR